LNGPVWTLLRLKEVTRSCPEYVAPYQKVLMTDDDGRGIHLHGFGSLNGFGGWMNNE
jgi:hypothetical protein